MLEVLVSFLITTRVSMTPFYCFNHLKSIPNCRHSITTKTMDEPYAFSVALHTDEDSKDIIENRKKIIKQLKWDRNVSFIVANQTHSDHITVIKENKHRGWEQINDAVEDCDALITDRKDIVLTILTADCVPILLMDTKKNVVAAIHAGWRGSKDEILAKTVKKMCDIFSCDTKNIIAGIGPAIGVCCYEVDSNVANYFHASQKVAILKEDKYMLDLPEVNRQQLLNVGLAESNIEMSDICTACEVDRFFSYRKEKGCSGRFMSMIGLK